MSLTTPSKIRELQSKLYRKAEERVFRCNRTAPATSAMKWCLGTRSPAASRCPMEPSFVSLAVKPVGKPDALCGLQNYVASSLQTRVYQLSR